MLYVDDILLLAPSVCELDNLFNICGRELNLLDMAVNLKQEAQLMLTNPRDAFRGQLRSPNSSIPYVRYSFLLCNSNFVFRIFDLEP